MAACIICRKLSDIFSDEHVIPDAIGGAYVIKKVCKPCNDHLGSKVDARLVKHTFVEFFRHFNGLKGKKGALPNPFESVGARLVSNSQKIALKADKSGNISPYLLPIVPTNLKAGSEFTLTLDLTDESKIDEILGKIGQRNGFDPNQIKKMSVEHVTIDQPEVQGQLSIDTRDFKIGLLKIAYEFVVDSIPSYFDDPTAIRISNALQNADDKNIQDIFIGHGLFENELAANFDFIDRRPEKHHIFACSAFGNLVCTVFIADIFAISFRMSSAKNWNGTLIIGVNHIKEKSWNRYEGAALVDKLYGPSRFRFEFLFPTKAAETKYNILSAQLAFGYYETKHGCPLIGKFGDVRYESVLEKLAQGHLKYTHLRDGSKMMKTLYELDEELYVRTVPGMNMHQVVTIMDEREFKGPL